MVDREGSLMRVLRNGKKRGRFGEFEVGNRRGIGKDRIRFILSENKLDFKCLHNCKYNKNKLM